MDKKLLDDCFSNDGQRLRHDEALAILRERVRPVVRQERVVVTEALNRPPIPTPPSTAILSLPPTIGRLRPPASN